MHIRNIVGVIALVASACASTAPTTTFVSSWKSPTAQPLQVKGAKVVAAVMLSDVASRRNAEDKLANEITARGAKGVPLYQIVEAGQDQAAAREAFAKADVQGLVVMSPSDADLTSNTNYSAAPYDTYWNGYYEYAQRGYTPSNKTVSVDTLIYSLRQNQLVWAGKSKTTDPTTVDKLVSDVTAATANELNRLMLFAQ